MNCLEIKHLRMIRAIAETGNMTRAAEKLCLTQSALSQQLKDIEGKLKVDLFSRGRKMILTAFGKKLMKTAELVLSEIDHTELEIAKAVSGESGELKVGTQCIFCYKWLPRVMVNFHKKFQNIEFEIGNSDDLVHDLESKRFDIVITAAPMVDDYSGLDFIPLFEDILVCVMPKGHPLSARPHVALEDFAALNLLSHAEKDKNRIYQNLLKTRGIEPRRFMTVGQPLAILEMVAAGFGVGVFPRWAVAGALAAGTVAARPLTRTGLPMKWAAAFLKNSHAPVFHQEFIRLLGTIRPEIGFAAHGRANIESVFYGHRSAAGG